MALSKVQQKWVDALRSGKYKQGQGKLRHGDSFCCLGVLCDLAEAEGITFGVKNESGGVHYENLYCALPESVRDWSGVVSGLGYYGPFGTESLVALNDRGTSFTQIADIIEGQPEGLFKTT